MRFPAWTTLGNILVVSVMVGFGQTTVQISGTIVDSAGSPIPSATVKLNALGLSTVSGTDGKFSFVGATALQNRKAIAIQGQSIQDGLLHVHLSEPSWVSVKATSLQGQHYGESQVFLAAGTQSISLPKVPNGLCFLTLAINDQVELFRALSVDGKFKPQGFSQGAAIQSVSNAKALEKATATAIYDEVVAVKSGYQTAYGPVTQSDSSGMVIHMLKESTTRFSFFVVSMKSIVELSGNDSGFGGDLRFGETGPGAGLRGADKICRTVAEKSLPGSAVKGWRAFLSVSSDAQGKQVNAMDRVGAGPWYDRTGRVLAPTKADLLNVRPANGDPTIQLDLPNENGIPNHRPDPSKPADDNHHMMTGSTTTGTLKSATATCKDWAVAIADATYGRPSAGFAWPRGGKVSNQGSHWMSTEDLHGCGKGIAVIEDGPGSNNVLTVGNGGGYGGFYCFALNP